MSPAKKLSPQRDWSAERLAERYSSLHDLSVSYEGHSESIITRLPDVSARGMFINTAKHFPEGAVLNVRFRLARTGVEVQTRCEVRYCMDEVGIGVEFVDISAEAAHAIEEELHSAVHPAARVTSLPSQTKRSHSAKQSTKGHSSKRAEHARKKRARSRSVRRPAKK